MVRVKQKNFKIPTKSSTDAPKATRSKYERKRATSPAKLKPPTSIKKYLQVVDLSSVKDVYRIENSDFVCIQMDCFTPRKEGIITDQPCQITEGATLTPHRIKLDENELVLAKKEDNHSITEYFPIRRSNRKTKKDVLEEKRRSIIDGIKSEAEEGLEVRCFDNKGRGVVAVQEFKRGDFVVEYRGDLINDLEAKRRELMYSNQNAGCYMYYFKHKNRQYCVDATIESTYLGRLVNHSRNGNLMTRIEEVNGKPHLVLIAKDDINTGDEITYDYGDRSKESLKHHPWLAR